MGELYHHRPRHKCDLVFSSDWVKNDVWKCSCGRLWRWKEDSSWRYGGRWVPCSRLRLAFLEILRTR